MLMWMWIYYFKRIQLLAKKCKINHQFHQNLHLLNIFRALTEKIVAVLPKLKCPHAIEPHQIQGLDFIHIFPVIQWLVKRSMEYRQERAAFVHSYAINQYHKAFAPPNKQPTGKTEQIMCNINSINEVYRPRRCFKRKTGPPADFSSQVQVTLLEYGMRGKMTASKSTESEEVEEQESNEVKISLSCEIAVCYRCAYNFCCVFLAN